MDILIPIIYTIVFLVIGIAFFNMGLSIALYLGCVILIPYLKFTVLGVDIPYGYIVGIIYIFLFYMKYRKCSSDFSIIFPYLSLFIALFFLTFFEFDTPWGFQIERLFRECFKIFPFSFILWNLAYNCPKNLQYIKWILIVSVIIAGLYAIFLMQMGGINPYTSFLVDYFDARQDNADLYSMSDSRLSMSSAGKIQATMSHPMQWILHLSLLTVIMSVYLIKTKKKLYAVLICFMVFNIFIAGVRTGIAALLIGFLYFCIREKKVKTILYVVILLLVVLSFNSDLKILFNSFIALEEGSVNGSSIAMRLEQLDGVFQEIGGYKLFVGKGYGWHNYYLLQNEFHPIILCFESLIFSVLCDSGLIGAGIWIVFFLLLFRLQRRILSTKTDIYLMDVMVIVYSGYVVGTGDYGYMLPFSIYYTFLMCALKTKIIQNNK